MKTDGCGLYVLLSVVITIIIFLFITAKIISMFRTEVNSPYVNKLINKADREINDYNTKTGKKQCNKYIQKMCEKREKNRKK